jgi:putative nucleotidyltransferase with HDIG domain
MDKPLNRELVVAGSQSLPAFPRIVARIVETLNDPDANLNVLGSFIERDPVVAGHVLSQANIAGSLRYGGRTVSDVFTAISLVGLARVREVAVLASLSQVLSEPQTAQRPAYFWRHSVAVGVCAIELSHWTPAPVNVDTALIAGLLHDVGQLWLQRFRSGQFAQSRSDAIQRGVDITVTEREIFGVDHADIGAWIAESWGLTPEITTAIQCHHAPDAVATQPLVAVVHVAEVLSDALGLTYSDSDHVSTISTPCCETLGLDWGDGSHRLFGRIEARSRQAAALFD